MRTQRKRMQGAARRGLSIALVSAGLIYAISSFGAEGKKTRVLKEAGAPVRGVRVQAVSRAVVDFGQLAKQPASPRSPSEAIPKLIPEPKEIDDSVNDNIKGEPAPNVPVDIPGPHIPSPSPTNNFAALDDIAMAPPGTPFFTIPPDTMGAVGTDAVNRVFVTLNNNYRVENKTTGAQIGSDVSMPNFWTGVGAVDPFDPRVQYDPYNDRWIVAAVSDAGTSTAAILVGVSATSDPGGSYFLFKVSARVGGDPAALNFADFPMLGFNKNWVVVSINMFNGNSGAFNDGRSLVIDYPTLRTGSLSGTYFTGLGFCVHPATTYSATEGTEYLVTHLSSASATYQMHTVTGTPGAPVFSLGATKTRPGGGWTQPGGNILPQSKTGSVGTCASASAALSKMESADAQVRSNVVFRNSTIWYPQTIGLPAGGSLTHTAAQWTQLNAAGDVVQGGRVEDPTATATNGGKWYAYPSISVNSTDDVLFGFSQFSSAQFAAAGYTYRDHVDAAGTMRDPLVYKAGEDCYSKDFSSGRNRWGDYSHTMADATGDCAFWTIEEYAKLSAPPTVGGSDSKWGTWWAKVNALACTCSPPATPVAGNNGPICAGETLQLTASTIGGATYAWTGPNGFTSSLQNPSIPNATAAASGTYSVTATVAGCTSAAGTTNATVNVCVPAAAGTLLPDGRAVTQTLPAGDHAHRAAVLAGHSYSVEVDVPFNGATTVGAGGPLPGLAVFRADGTTALTTAPASRTGCGPATANRLTFTPSAADVAGGPLQIQVVDSFANGYKYRIRLEETTLYCARWSINGYNAFIDLQNTSDCPISGNVTLLNSSGGTVTVLPFTLNAASATQINIPSLSPLVGSALLTHDGAQGAVTGGIYMAQPGGFGANFRWSFVPVRAYGGTDGL